ncbi:MAG: ABC-2 type transport system ATP-binding protein [Myxococcota bacterium]
MANLFRLDGINHFYGAFQALTDITVAAKPGAVGLLGPNGAGKTTLIKTLLGLLDPDTGGATVLGADIRTHATEIRRRVGYMPENECFFSSLTGIEAVAYAGRLSGLPRNQAFRRAHEVLDYAGLDEARYRATTEYSTGMKQRVKLAQALVHGPELVLLDEPTNGLDPKGRDEMLQIIEDLSRIPVSVLLSSHLLNDVERVCDTVLVLVSGKLRHYGPLDAFTAGRSGEYEVKVKAQRARLAQGLERAGISVTVDPIVETRLTCEIFEADLPMFWKVSAEVGVQVRHFAPVVMSLETAFMQFLQEPPA